jgi:hypothetical protein
MEVESFLSKEEEIIEDEEDDEVLEDAETADFKNSVHMCLTQRSMLAQLCMSEGASTAQMRHKLMKYIAGFPTDDKPSKK